MYTSIIYFSDYEYTIFLISFFNLYEVFPASICASDTRSLNVLESTYSLIINNSTRIFNIVAARNKYYFVLEHIKSDILASTFQ